MHEFVSFNYIPVAANDVSISALSAAALYGKGIFTTIAIYDGGPFLWDKHWRRLETGAAKLNIDLAGFSEYKTRKALNEITKKNCVSDGRARVTIFDGSASKFWPFKPQQRASLLMVTGDSHLVTDDFRLTVSPHSVNSQSPLAGVKSCNYLEKLIAFDEVKARGFDEAIQINERGQITSAVMANVLWLKGDELYTPSLKTGCLAGTTREYVLENLECREVEVSIEELDSVDAIFLTSAGIGIIAVFELDGKRLARTSHPIMALVSRPGES